MKLGDLEFHIIQDGYVWLDGGAMFGVVPKTMWEKKAPADARNRIRLAMNCLLILSGGKRILVETGGGDKWSPKLRDIYNVQGPRLTEGLREFALHPQDIDIVVDTHLHFDHCGGNTRIEKDKIIPAFPNARYAMQRADFEHGLHPTERDRASYFLENYAPLQPTGQLMLLDDEVTTLAPGVEAIRVPGHTAGMLCVKLTGGGKTAFCFADLIPTAAHLPLPWIMGFDLYPLTTLENKKKWIPKVAREGWIALFVHDVATPAAYLRERDDAWDTEPVKID